MARHSTMVCQVCRLQPHVLASAPPLAISAEMIWREGGCLELSYGLLPLGGLATPVVAEQVLGSWAEANSKGTRRDLLWEHTCFEAFLGLPNDERYWELNVSPSGDWNLYRFERYRQGGEPEVAAIAPTITVQHGGRGLRCRVQLDPRGFWPASVVPDIALTMVVERVGGSLSYWALAHPGDQADFHDRRGFLVP